MPDSLATVQDVARSIGLTLPDHRLPAIAAAVEAAMQQTEIIRTNPTPVPAPTAFDPAWSEKK